MKKIVNLVVDGIEFNDVEVEVPSCILKALNAVEQNKEKFMTGYERVDIGDKFYSIRSEDSTKPYMIIEQGAQLCESKYRSGDYYSNYDVALNNARADELVRNIRRFSIEQRQKLIDWQNTPYYWVIYYNYSVDKLSTILTDCVKCFGDILFETQEQAQACIDKYYQELIWYFTEYKDSMMELYENSPSEVLEEIKKEYGIEE